MKTDNIEIKTQLKTSEVLSRISEKTKAISSCFAYMIATAYGNDSQLVGEVSRNGFILARARPFTHNSSKPVFKGLFVESSEGVILRGNFEYNCFRKYFFWISTIVFATAEIFIVLSIFAPENQPILSLKNIAVAGVLPGIQLVAYLFTHYTKDRFFKDDCKWIEDQLRKLLKTAQETGTEETGTGTVKS